jgi:hypothetical protein
MSPTDTADPQRLSTGTWRSRFVWATPRSIMHATGRLPPVRVKGRSPSSIRRLEANLLSARDADIGRSFERRSPCRPNPRARLARFLNHATLIDRGMAESRQNRANVDEGRHDCALKPGARKARARQGAAVVTAMGFTRAELCPSARSFLLPFLNDARQRSAICAFTNYSTRVKGAHRAARFFCGVSPFFAPQKNQKNRTTVQK